MIIDERELAVMCQKSCKISKRPERWNQVGGTCGLYALDGALQIRNVFYAPPRKSLGHPISSRQIAKSKGLTKVGELNDVNHVVTLATEMGYSRAEVKQFSSEDQLFTVVKTAVDNQGSVVMPFLCRDDSGELCVLGGFAHYCLVFGYGQQNSVKLILATNYGYYHLWEVQSLQQSNFGLRDWAQQDWCKLKFFYTTDGTFKTGWKEWKNEWVKQNEIAASLDGYAQGCKQDGLYLGVAGEEKQIFPWPPLAAARSAIVQKVVMFKNTTIPAGR
jgi:hypothetical protein